MIQASNFRLNPIIYMDRKINCLMYHWLVWNILFLAVLSIHVAIRNTQLSNQQLLHVFHLSDHVYSDDQRSEISNHSIQSQRRYWKIEKQRNWGEKNISAFSVSTVPAAGLVSLHYSDVIMGVIASQITSLTIVYSSVYSDADQRKHQSSASLALCAGNSPVTGEFPTQRASNAENVSIWWRHHGCWDIWRCSDGQEWVPNIL